MIKVFEKGKLVSVQLEKYEQYDLALRNNKMLREQNESKLKKAADSLPSTGDPEEVWSAHLQEGLQEET